jgi:dienelactone hydrolase
MIMKKFNFIRTVTATSIALCLVIPAAVGSATSNKDLTTSPVREIAKKLGAYVRWDRTTHTITVTKGPTTLILTIDDSKAILNGQSVFLVVPVRIISNQAIVPVEFISQIFASEESSTTESEYIDTADLFLDHLKIGNGTKAIEYMSPALKKSLSPQLLDILWSNYEQIYGKAVGKPSKSEKTNAVHRNVTYQIQTNIIPFHITLRLNQEGQIDDMNMSPSTTTTYQNPAYDNPATYTEQEVIVGHGELALPGTLTLPVGNGPFPAIVLVHGSGPNDRDSSIGGAKPLRDLSVGLAAKGIAVLRYDKVTYEHTFKVGTNPRFTLKNETVVDAISAVKLLHSNPEVDSAHIYVAGHSQGGYAMPLIVAADTDGEIAGTILLAGPSSKFVDVIVKQQKELINRIKGLGQDTAPFEEQAAQWSAISAIVNDPQYSINHLPESFPIQPAYWWYEQREYKPSELAKKQHGPMLVLQGENDWQVPLSEFSTWKSELKNRNDVEYKSYPNVTHLLNEYSSISTGQEYNQPSNVAPIIIDDIATWIKRSK